MPSTPIRTAVATTLVAILAAGCNAAEPAAAPAPTAQAERPTVIVHRSETCGCCGEYEDILAEDGFDVVQEMYADVAAVKDSFGIPSDQWSCHTNEIDGYFVEGHVPIEAIDDLLATRPDIDGIALAGMPAGSPGMAGEQTEPFVVTTVVDGEVTGELGTY